MAARRRPVLLSRVGARQGLERLLENVRGGPSAVLEVRAEACVRFRVAVSPLVALAAPGLSAEVAAERPLVCVGDDAQWLGAASRQVLGFVSRRLVAESVAIVFALREPSRRARAGGLPEMMLGGARRA